MEDNNQELKKGLIESMEFAHYVITDTPKSYKHLLNSGNSGVINTGLSINLNNLTEDNWEEVAESRFVELPGNDIEAAPLIELVTETESFRFATDKNFSVVLGMPKSRKSTFITLLIAELIKSISNESTNV